jgi:hypothetical protein
MRPQTVTVSSQASSAWIPVDMYQTPFNIGFGVTLSAGASLTYTVEHTFDDIFDPTVTPVAFSHAAVAAETTNQDGNYSYPVRAIRLTVSVYTNGSAKLTILQGRKA